MTIPISVALKAHMAKSATTLCTILLAELTAMDGSPPEPIRYGFTDHDNDLVIGGVTYISQTSYSRTDVKSTGDLAVDNLEVSGMLRSPFITDDDLDAGLWDFAKLTISIVNWADLTMGHLIQRTGKLGEVTVDRNQFRAELNGMMQAYSRTIGELTSPSCRAVLGDARCKVNLTAGSPSFTVTGTLDGVGVDNRTCYDAGRLEEGPSGGVAIVGITQADPGVVTLDAALGVPSGSPVTIAGVVGMEEVNTTTVISNADDTAFTFELPVDTSSFGAYVSGGTVTPLGSGSGYFDNGVITFTSGLNAGLRMEVQSYVPGQWVLELPMPYAMAAGDEYTMHAGCDYSMATCRDRFDNIVNFRGEPYVGGTDKLMQVGKQ